MSIKSFFSQKFVININDKTVFSMDHRNTSVLAGVMAGALIFEGAVFILNSPILSLARMSYGFFILLPLSYYQMRKYEETATKHE